jgi:hypothetical protein
LAKDCFGKRGKATLIVAAKVSALIIGSIELLSYEVRYEG